MTFSVFLLMWCDISKQTEINEKIWPFNLEWNLDDKEFVLNIHVLDSNNTKWSYNRIVF